MADLSINYSVLKGVKDPAAQALYKKYEKMDSDGIVANPNVKEKKDGVLNIEETKMSSEEFKAEMLYFQNIMRAAQIKTPRELFEKIAAPGIGVIDIKFKGKKYIATVVGVEGLKNIGITKNTGEFSYNEKNGILMNISFSQAIKLLEKVGETYPSLREKIGFPGSELENYFEGFIYVIWDAIKKVKSLEHEYLALYQLCYSTSDSKATPVFNVQKVHEFIKEMVNDKESFGSSLIKPDYNGQVVSWCLRETYIKVNGADNANGLPIDDPNNPFGDYCANNSVIIFIAQEK